MSAKKSKIPTFQTDREERAFWSKHSVEEFGGDLEDLDVEIRRRERNKSPSASPRRT